MSRPMIEQIMQHQVVLQADGEPEGERENSCQLFTHHHAVAVIVLVGAAEALIICWRSQSC